MRILIATETAGGGRLAAASTNFVTRFDESHWHFISAPSCGMVKTKNPLLGGDEDAVGYAAEVAWVVKRRDD